MINSFARIFFFLLFAVHLSYAQTPIWSPFEVSLESASHYDNPLYEVKEFYAEFLSPTGRIVRVNGFWYEGNQFKIRFAPDEIGNWTYHTVCSDGENLGLHNREGQLQCVENKSDFELYKRGPIKHKRGDYFLRHTDGTPFFFTGCTAWNGALKSTDEEWNTYLNQRLANHYNVIQFVTTQWRGCEKDREGEVAFTGSGKIEINPSFYKRMDQKIDEINGHGLVAAPVLLWALPKGEGRHLSPGYYLPDAEAILLARYMVARYGAHQVIWFLGGDGTYVKDFEQRWKRIGREVFADYHPGVVAQHPGGSSWIGEAYKDEAWLDLVGYQSSHNNGEWVVNWINKGPMAKTWDQLPPKPIINLEPNYEEIFHRITAEDVRNASYWSVFATPPAGISYGANGIWPWIQYEGEGIENHSLQSDKGPSTWKQSIEFSGSLQVGYLSAFIQSLPWWDLKPAAELLIDQPGDQMFNHFISVLADDFKNMILVYTPVKQEIRIRNSQGYDYQGQWFDPVNNKYVDIDQTLSSQDIMVTPPRDQDYILILTHLK